jgi:hypothetical protein
MADEPKPYAFATALRASFRQDIETAGNDPEKLGEMLCSATMICVTELQERYGAKTAHAAVKELVPYVNTMEMVLAKDVS